VFVVVRGLNSFGNMSLLRDGPGLVQWLHVSKYPPSITYDALELGIASLLLACLFAGGERVRAVLAPVRLLGQVALFYYLLHIHLLVLAAELAGVREKLGLAAAYYGAVGALAVLFPLCVAYRRYKLANPGGWRQFI
jgi:hypothetical protein